MWRSLLAWLNSWNTVASVDRLSSFPSKSHHMRHVNKGANGVFMVTVDGDRSMNCSTESIAAFRVVSLDCCMKWLVWLGGSSDSQRAVGVTSQPLASHFHISRSPKMFHLPIFLEYTITTCYTNCTVTNHNRTNLKTRKLWCLQNRLNKFLAQNFMLLNNISSSTYAMMHLLHCLSFGIFSMVYSFMSLSCIHLNGF